LCESQNSDGGWGGMKGAPSSVEETALATEIVVSIAAESIISENGLNWLMHRIEEHSIQETTPIGFYFAKLWYYEKLYPLIFTVSALKSARQKDR